MKNQLIAALAAAACLSLAPFAAASAKNEPTLAASLATQSNPMTIVFDARKAPLGLAYTHMTIPVQAGSFTIDYPEWIPGEHGPTGPLNNLS
ncbi:MAG: hypothetical protein ACYDA1_09855, partial [Vulcanimicrobiaceae bacterium]